MVKNKIIKSKQCKNSNRKPTNIGDLLFFTCSWEVLLNNPHTTIMQKWIKLHQFDTILVLNKINGYYCCFSPAVGVVFLYEFQLDPEYELFW